MWVALAVTVVAVLCAGGIAMAAPREAAGGGAKPAATDQRQKAGRLSRKEIAERLDALARTPPSSGITLGATCYRQAAPPATVEYVCPVCGARTHYSLGDREVYQTVRDLPSLRRGVKALPGIDATLDESRFCRQCTPGAKSPTLTLIVRYPAEGKVQRTDGVTPADLELLRQFLGAERAFDDPLPAHAPPLRDSLPRLRQLLGVEDGPTGR